MSKFAPCLLFTLVVALPGGTAFAADSPADPPGREVKREVRIIRVDGSGKQQVITDDMQNLEGDLRLEGLPPMPMGGGSRAVLGVMPAMADGPSGTKGDAKAAPGVGIAEVTPDGGAAKAGLKAGDRILSVGGRAVSTPEELVASMDGAKAGVPVKVEYLRDGKSSAVDVTPQSREMRVMVLRRGPHGEDMQGKGMQDDGTGRRKAPHMGRMGPGRGAGMGFHQWHGFGAQEGMELATLTPALGKYFGTDKGVLVVRAKDRLKLQDGDVLQSIGGRAVTEKAQARRILRSYAPGEAVPLTVLRDRKVVKLEATMPEPRRVEVTATDDGEQRVRVKVMERPATP